MTGFVPRTNLCRGRGFRSMRAATQALTVQGQAVDVGGYDHPDETKVEAAMRPRAVWNGVLG